jgi:hypothetical protein
MATSVENRICNACGAEIRASALFCYNCGGSVAPEVVVALKDKKALSDAWRRENIGAEKNGDNAATIEKKTVEEAADKPIPKPELQEEPKLQSAATMRRSKARNIPPKRVEVIWEEHENAPNLWFILVAIFLTLFAAGILYLALRLR